MIQKILPSNGKVLIIDDKAEDVKIVQNILAQNGIPYIFYDYSFLKDAVIEKVETVRMIFLDIRLEDGIQGIKNIGTVLASTIEKVVRCKNGPYCIVLWTNEIVMKNQIEEYLLQNLSDEETTLPTYICALDKKDFECKTEDVLVNSLIKQLDGQRMMNFLIKWEDNTMQISSNIIRLLLYGLKAKLNNSEIEKILVQLAILQNSDTENKKIATRNVLFSLVELVKDRYLEIVTDNELIDKLSEYWSIDFNESQIIESIKSEIPIAQKASINTFLNANTYDSNLTKLPGKVISLTEDELPFDKDDFRNSTFGKNFNGNTINIGEDSIDIVSVPVEIDITPNCDYAQNKNYMLRTVFGYKININKIQKGKDTLWKTGKYSKKIKDKIKFDYVYVTPELFINDQLCVYVFNTQYMYMEKKNFYEGHEYLLRFNNDILSEIRKKGGEVISRLGINNI